MAAKGKKKPKRKLRRIRYVYSRRRMRDRDPKGFAWMKWNHDVDTILHELVKNPSIVSVKHPNGARFIGPQELVAYAEQFADALHAMQERRRPKGLRPGWE